jgi:hypothetical protein
MYARVITALAATALASCVAVEEPVRVARPVPGVVYVPNDPYYYSPTYCEGCWYGQWGGRIGYHRGGGRPWERQHVESDHHLRVDGGDIRHEGHR